MSKALEGLAGFIFVAIVVAFLGAGYLIYRLVEEAIQAIDREVGPLFYLIGGGVTLFAFVLVIVGGAIAFVQWLALRSRQIKPDGETGLYPVHKRRGGYENPNDPRVQVLGVMSRGRRPTAPMVQRVLSHNDWNLTPAQQDLPALPEPEALNLAADLPRKVEIYNSPLPRDLALPVGVDAAGQPVALPLRNRGNVLIAGDPGNGKSELIGSMIAGLLRQDATGRLVQFQLADLKMIDFGNMPPLAAMVEPVAVEVETAFDMVRRLRDETEERYSILMDAKARSLEEYQRLTGKTMPHRVMFLDEFADLTFTDDGRFSREFVAIAMKIARKGRAAGVTLVMATQRPSADVIPSSLRALASTKIALRVARGESSQAILDMRGAEKLPSVPGRCIVIDQAPQVVQAYASGLEGGRFDAFLASLPLSGQRTAIPPKPAIPAVPEPVYRPAAPVEAGIPVFNPEDQADYTPEQRAHILRLYQRHHSLKEVQRQLYDNQEGGYWFYRIREVVQAAGYDTSPNQRRRRRVVAH